MFLEPLLGRDEALIREAIRDFLASNSPEDLFLTVARFAVMAYAPSQHAKHALLACLAAHDIREECGDRWTELLTECAIYVAQSRQPWSEPPILDPPEPSEDRSIDELRAAVAEGDRLRAERWLAARSEDPELANDYFAVASDDFEDFGHKLIVARAAWRLAEILGDKGRFAVLRVGVWEMCAYRGERYLERGGDISTEVLIDDAVEAGGEIEAMRRVFLFDAAAGTSVERRVRDYLAGGSAQGTVHSAQDAEVPVLRSTREHEARSTNPIDPVSPEPANLSTMHYALCTSYPLARDYASFLKSHAVAKRLGDPRIIDAAKHNLDHGISFEEWSFA